MKSRLVLVHALSPLHAGTGRALGAIDLPIARERPTGIPLLPGSSIKGALRARCEDDKPWQRDIFGPETDNSSEHGGAVQFSDLHLVFLPVRSLAGTFAWVTSPYLLQRFARTAREAGAAAPPLPPAPAQENLCTVVGRSLIVQRSNSTIVVLEDLDLKPGIDNAHSGLGLLAAWIAERVFPDGEADSKAWRQSLENRVCLVHDNMMSYLMETAVEVSARIRLDANSKTVAQGALWYEEALPCESILAGIAVASSVKAYKERQERTGDELLARLEKLSQGLVQLGGKATVGHGSCAVRMVGGQS
jgi:CRISPR-associated protein Cmr4